MCVDFEKDLEGKLTGLCYMGDKILNGAIVRAGWALAYQQESRDFLDVEKKARLKDRGYGSINLWLHGNGVRAKINEALS